MSVASLEPPRRAYAALSLPGWLDVHHDDSRRQWVTPGGRRPRSWSCSPVARRIVAFLQGGDEARLSAPELVQPVLRRWRGGDP